MTPRVTLPGDELLKRVVAIIKEHLRPLEIAHKNSSRPGRMTRLQGHRLVTWRPRPVGRRLEERGRVHGRRASEMEALGEVHDRRRSASRRSVMSTRMTP